MSVFVCVLHVPFVPVVCALATEHSFLVCREWSDAVCGLPNLKHSFRECEYLGCQMGTNLATFYKPLCSDGARLCLMQATELAVQGYVVASSQTHSQLFECCKLKS